MVAGPYISETNKSSKLSDHARVDLISFYKTQNIQVHFDLDSDEVPAESDSVPIGFTCFPLSYALLDGRKINPTSGSRQKSAASSLIKVIINGIRQAAEVHTLFLHSLPKNRSPPVVFAEVAWLNPLDLSPVEGDPWASV